jgi:hypothetical protein
LIADIFRLIRAPAIAFAGGFLVVGAWKLAPMMPNLLPIDFGTSFFADGGRIGYPPSAPLVRSCIFDVLDLGRDVTMEPSAAYAILKAATMQAGFSAMLGRPDPRPGTDQTSLVASKWGQLATCIYAKENRTLCDPDNRAAAVEASTKFFLFANQAASPKSATVISASDARVIEGISDRLLSEIKSNRRDGTLIAADFGLSIPDEVGKIMREEKPGRDICKR